MKLEGDSNDIYVKTNEPCADSINVYFSDFDAWILYIYMENL